LLREQSEHIIFLPWQAGAALEELLTNAGLFVLPSELEGLSLALLEAMAAGVCVLTSDIPENKELVDGVGFTFRSGDALDLERMLALLLRHPEMRRAAARLALQKIEESYRWPGIARTVEDVYYDVLGWSRLPSERPATVTLACNCPSEVSAD
jgi:glycosyltransferase involved in cell wall biosynthesis